MKGEPYIDLITGKPIDPWLQDYLDRREAAKHSEEAEMERIVQTISGAFERELRAIMKTRRAA